MVSECSEKTASKSNEAGEKELRSTQLNSFIASLA